MADNIGTQLAVKLEEISRLHGVMDSLSYVGRGLKDFDSLLGFVNVFEYLEDRHNVMFDEFDTFVRQKILPIVAHINDKV
jgi:hypothetical protein